MSLGQTFKENNKKKTEKKNIFWLSFVRIEKIIPFQAFILFLYIQPDCPNFVVDTMEVLIK